MRLVFSSAHLLRIPSSTLDCEVSQRCCSMSLSLPLLLYFLCVRHTLLHLLRPMKPLILRQCCTVTVPTSQFPIAYKHLFLVIQARTMRHSLPLQTKQVLV